MTNLAELEKRFKQSDKWDIKNCEELVKLADMEKEFEEADGENFEKVLEKAADKLGIELY